MKVIYEVVTKTDDDRQIVAYSGTDIENAKDMLAFCKSMPIVKQAQIVSRETK